MNNICLLIGHKLYSSVSDVACAAHCTRCGYVERAIMWPRSKNSTTKYVKQNQKVNMKDDNINEDETPVYSMTDTIRHIIGALLLSGFVIMCFTVGIMSIG